MIHSIFLAKLSALEVFTIMRYINLHFTYLLK